MAMLADNQTMFCVWNIGHGGQFKLAETDALLR
jgi:hypothetical protein